MSLERKEIFEFGEFRLDVDEHTIERIDGERNGSLTEKAFQILVLLVRRRGHLVSKDELIQYVWPDTIVEDNNLEKCVHHIRQFLGETSEGTRYIETVRKHGYRFVGKVQALEVSGSWLPETFRNDDELIESTDPIADKPTERETTAGNGLVRVGRYRYPFGRALLLTGIILAFIGGLAGTGYYLFVRAGPVADEIKTIAVLPLMPIDPANRNDFYEMGIPDALINRLSSTKRFVPRPLSAMRKYKAIDQDPLAAGREMKVDYVLASNYQIANGQIKVTSQFWDVTTGKVEDTFTGATESANLFSAQDAIANDISNKLLARFGFNAVQFQAKRGTKNEEAYRFYLMAMNLGEERGVQNVLKSLEYLERAVALDPNYANAWAGVALIHNDIVGHTDSGQNEHFQRSMEAIGKALAIDPNLSEPYSALCNNKNGYEYDVTGAETACKRAVELDPNSPVAHKTYAKFLYSRGRFDEAIAEIKTAMDLQPVSFRNQQIYALTLYYARRYDEAEKQFKRLIELNPNQSNFIQDRLVKVLEAQGKESEAFEYFVRMLTVQNTDNGEVERFKKVYKKSGWRGVVAEQIRIAEAYPDQSHFGLACLNAKIGSKDKAFDHLEKAYRERSFHIAILQVEPQLDRLRNDPRYADLIRRVESR